MKAIVRSLGTLCLAGAAVAGCAADPDLGTETSAAELDSFQAPVAQGVRLRFVHGSPTSPAVDIYVGAGTSPVFTTVAFGTATPYVVVPPDGLQLVLRTAGAAATDAPLYTSEVVAAQTGDTITTIAGGVLGSAMASTRFRVLPYTEAFAAPERGHAMVRFVHDSYGVAATSFDVGADGTIEVPGVAAFTASDAAGIAVARPDRDLQLAIDTGTPGKRLTTFTLSHEVLEGRGGTFLTVVGVPAFVPSDNRGLALLAVSRHHATLIRQNPSVFVLPVIPDSTGVDVFAIGREVPFVQVATNLGFGALGPALQVAPTERGIHLVIARSGGSPLAFHATGALVAGERYLAIASGFTDGRARVTLTVERDGFDRTLTAGGRLRAVAASPDAPTVDFGQFAPASTAFTGIAGLAAVAYRQSSAEAGVEVSSAPLNPSVQVTGTTTALRFRFGALLPTDRDLGILAGAFAPLASDVPARFVVIKMPVSGAWTATALSPQ